MPQHFIRRYGFSPAVNYRLNMPLSFLKLDISKITNYTILLDIDGTLTHDGSDDISEEVLAAIKELQETNKIYLCSNKKNHERNHKVAEQTGIPYLETDLRKPSKKILELLPKDSPKDLLVIGDKFLTDGLFAHNIKAKFLKVGRITSSSSTFFTKLTYLIDDLAAKLLGVFFPPLPRLRRTSRDQEIKK
jgi:predicted HAD superfamily phosphohydrolase YqeG